MTAPPLRSTDLLVVSLGGAVGALLRWVVDVSLPDTRLLWDIVAINVLGAFALGALPLLAWARRSHRVTLLLGPGLLGGFTTVSTWADDVRRLVADGDRGGAATLVAVTLAAGLLAAHLGRRLSHRPEPEDAVT